MLPSSIFTPEAVPFVVFLLPQLFSLLHCACTLLSFLFFIQHFVSFRWLSILLISRFMTLQGAVYVGALLAISGPIIRFFKRPLFFSFSFCYFPWIFQPVLQHICFCCDLCLCKFDKAYEKKSWLNDSFF